MFQLPQKYSLYMLTIFIAVFLGEKDEIGVGTDLETIDNANSYPTQLKNDLQEAQNDWAGGFF